MIWATLSALLINILLGSFQLFFAWWSASLWGWNNPVQRCLPVRLHSPRRRRRGGFTHWLTDHTLMCNRRRPAAASSRRASFFSFQHRLTPSCILHRAQQHPPQRICMWSIAVHSFGSLAFFVALGFVGNVITVMINSPWQADDDADNQAR